MPPEEIMEGQKVKEAFGAYLTEGLEGLRKLGRQLNAEAREEQRKGLKEQFGIELPPLPPKQP